MTENLRRSSRSAADLRREFDLAFAEAVHSETIESEYLMAIRAGTAPYAVRLSSIGGLFADKRITPLPKAPSGLRGIAGFRGAIHPVYDLRILLGQPSGTNPRWMVLVENTLALAFDEVDGCMRTAREQIFPVQSAAGAVRHYQEMVTVDNTARPILNLSSLLQSIKERVRSAASGRETLQ